MLSFCAQPVPCQRELSSGHLAARCTITCPVVSTETSVFRMNLLTNIMQETGRGGGRCRLKAGAREVLANAKQPGILSFRKRRFLNELGVGKGIQGELQKRTISF